MSNDGASSHLRPKPEMKLNEIIKNDEIFIEALQLGFGDQRTCDEDVFEEIVKTAIPILTAEPNIVNVKSKKIKIIGPIRGQYFDLLNILTRVSSEGYKPVLDNKFTATAEVPFKNTFTTPVSISDDEKLLFLGDMIDGGPESIEVLLLLLSLKIKYPKQIFLLRGRRESRYDWEDKGHSILLKRQLRKWYGEAIGVKLFESACDLFTALPVAAIANDSYWCVSGGIGPGLTSPETLLSVSRSAPDATTTGLVCDAIWSDPMEDEDEEIQTTALFLHNYEKGLSYNYSFNAVMQFLHSNNFLSIIRGVSFTDNRDMPLQVTKQSHNSCGRPWHYQYSCYDPGYRVHKRSPTTNFPVSLSLFSAPRFLSENENKGAMIILNDSKIDVKQFTAVCRPFVLPKMTNALAWSLPVISFKTTAVAAALWEVINPRHDDPLHRMEEKLRVCILLVLHCLECFLPFFDLLKKKKKFKQRGEGTPQDRQRAKLLGFQRLCKLVKKKERIQGNIASTNGLSGLVEGSDISHQKIPQGRPPVFYKAEQFGRLSVLKECWKTIQDEAIATWEERKMLDLHRPTGAWVGSNADEFIQHYIEQEGWIPSYQTKTGRNYNWLNYGLMHNGQVFKANGACCSGTISLLQHVNKIAKIRVCGFSAMLPKSDIKPHRDQVWFFL